jgi:ribonuclease HII
LILLNNLLSFHTPGLIEAGVDEAGRGCLAGPVVAAAAILRKDFTHPMLTDSKLLTAKQRNVLEIMIKNEAIAYAVGIVDNNDIDEINILNATFRAMESAVTSLNIKPELLLIDGNRFKNNLGIDFKCIVKGDSTYFSIAAASVLAKTARDRIMEQFHSEYPVYQWCKNKGYPTQVHRKAIFEHGISPYHRKSFRLLDNAEQLHFNF